jgi:hypothetical protein
MRKLVAYPRHGLLEAFPTHDCGVPAVFEEKMMLKDKARRRDEL